MFQDGWKRGMGRAIRGAPLRLGACVLALAVAAGGCDELLEVEENPNTVPGDELDNPTSLGARLLGAEGDMFFSWDMAIVWGGLFTDELIDGTGFDEIDERRVTPDNGTIGAVDEAEEGFDGLWTPLQKAAFTSNLLQEDILADKFPTRIPDPANSAEVARMSLFAGWSKQVLGEFFCTTAFNGTGPELTSLETWALAEQEFDIGLAATNATAEVRNALLVARSRSRLMQGDDQGAVSDAQQVPADFKFVIGIFSSNSQKEENDIWNMLTDSQRFSVAPAFRGLTIDDTGMDDPRIEEFQDPNDRFASDGSTELFQLTKYNERTKPIEWLTGMEALYNIAEVQGGQQAVDIINQVRQLEGIDVEFQSSDPVEIRNKLFDEKARTLFMEGQRMGDLRRWLDRFGVDLFPTGPGFGDQTCFPLPDAERDNNPDI